MKTKSFYVFILLISIFSWSCSNNDLSQGTLKSSLNNSVQELNTALNVISASKGYQVLSTSAETANAASMVKSSVLSFDSTYNSILLTDIAGVYDYKATYKRGSMSAFRFFSKTGESDHMIVRLPEEKVKNPRVLLHFTPADTLLTNNYVIDLSKYEYHFNRYLGWDYQMASTINIKNVDAGALAIQSSNSRENGYKYASEFVFADGYKASCTYASGDTAVATYAINDGTKILYAEKYTSIKSSGDNRHREKQYSLTIGNVEIVRERNHHQNTLDSAKVYVNGVLQLNSKVEIVDADSTSTDETENCVINRKRDLKITFDDGTSATISELLGTSVTTIRTLFALLRQASFATAIIDWIAWDIYTNRE
ncbi:MAG: hypothetical protein QM800_11940 [Paludibacter sp.]